MPKKREYRVNAVLSVRATAYVYAYNYTEADELAGELNEEDYEIEFEKPLGIDSYEVEDE